MLAVGGMTGDLCEGGADAFQAAGQRIHNESLLGPSQ